MFQDENIYVTMPTVFSREDAPWIKEQHSRQACGKKSRWRMRRHTRKRSTLNRFHSGSRTQHDGMLTADCESFARGIPRQSGAIRRSHPGYEFLKSGWGKGGGVGF